MASHDIEIVITWVDGSDPWHRAQRQQFDQAASISHKAAFETTRFADNGEVYYLIASILKYAPFVTKIHIVTDHQKPHLLETFAQDGLCNPAFIAIVDHEAAFSGLPAVLPTFNSLSIEAAIWNIPGLSENFIYCNDDFFLNAPLSSEAFFHDGKPVVHGRMTSRLRPALKRFLRWFGPADAEDAMPSFAVAQEQGAQLAGVGGRYLRVGHYPHPLRRSTLSGFYASHYDILRQQLSYRFRNIAQHSPISLANHIELECFGVKPRPEHETAYIKPRQKRAVAPILRTIEKGTAPFGCTQSQDELDIELRDRLSEIMIEKFGSHLPRRVIDHLRTLR
jgi:hypothetical protein